MFCRFGKPAKLFEPLCPESAGQLVFPAQRPGLKPGVVDRCGPPRGVLTVGNRLAPVGLQEALKASRSEFEAYSNPSTPWLGQALRQKRTVTTNLGT